MNNIALTTEISIRNTGYNPDMVLIYKEDGNDYFLGKLRLILV